MRGNALGVSRNGKPGQETRFSPERHRSDPPALPAAHARGGDGLSLQREMSHFFPSALSDFIEAALRGHSEMKGMGAGSAELEA